MWLKRVNALVADRRGYPRHARIFDVDVRELVRVMLRDYDAGEAAVLDHREELRTSGCRLVSHDQVEEHQLELRDAITGELLFRGPFEEGMAKWDKSWADVDAVDGQVPMPETDVPGVPKTLALAVREWVENSVREAREYAEG